MPLLPTFSASKADLPISGGRRASAEEISGGADLARLGKTVAANAANILQDTEERETRQALVASTEIRAKYARELDAATLDGRDLGKLKEAMQTDLGKVGEQFQTTRGYDALAVNTANTELMFDEQASRINVQRASADAEREGSKFLNSQGAILRSNPLALPMAEKDAEALAATFTKVPAHVRSKIEDGLKKELNMAAAIASARIDPESTKKRLEDGEWNLTPQQREVATGRADMEIRSKRAEEQYQRGLREYKEAEANEAARDTHFKAIMATDTPSGQLRRQIMDDPALKPQTREHLIVFMEQRSKALVGQEKKSDPTAVRELWLDIHAPDTDPRKIYNGDKIFAAVTAGKVNTSDANTLMSLVSNQKDENNRSIGSKLRDLSINFSRAVNGDPRMLKFDAAQRAEIQNDYTALVVEKVAEKRAANQSPASLFNPTDKEYVGSAAFMQQAITAASSRLTAAAQSQIPVVNSQAEYDALPDGAQYRDSSGNVATKSKKKMKSADAPRDPLGNLSDVAAP